MLTIGNNYHDCWFRLRDCWIRWNFGCNLRIYKNSALSLLPVNWLPRQAAKHASPKETSTISIKVC